MLELWTEGFSVCWSHPVPQWLLFVDGRFFCVLVLSLTAVVVVCGWKVFLCVGLIPYRSGCCLWTEGFLCVLFSSCTTVVVVCGQKVFLCVTLVLTAVVVVCGWKVFLCVGLVLTAVVVVCGQKVFLCVVLVLYHGGCCLWMEGFSVCWSCPILQWLLFVDARFFCVLLSSCTAVVVVCGWEVFLSVGLVPYCGGCCLWMEGFSVCWSRPILQWLLFVDGKFFCVLLSSRTAVVVVCGWKIFLCVGLVPYCGGCCLWMEGFSVCYSHPILQWLLFVDGRFFCVLLSSLTTVVVVCGQKVFLCVTLVPYCGGCCLSTEGFFVCCSRPVLQWLLFVDRRFFCVLLLSRTAVVVVCQWKVFLCVVLVLYCSDCCLWTEGFSVCYSCPYCGGCCLSTEGFSVCCSRPVLQWLLFVDGRFFCVLVLSHTAVVVVCGRKVFCVLVSSRTAVVVVCGWKVFLCVGLVPYRGGCCLFTVFTLSH